MFGLLSQLCLCCLCCAFLGATASLPSACARAIVLHRSSQEFAWQQHVKTRLLSAEELARISFELDYVAVSCTSSCWFSGLEVADVKESAVLVGRF